MMLLFAIIVERSKKVNIELTIHLEQKHLIKKGHTTIRIAAFFILISAFLEFTSILSEVPLFGAMRSGLIAIFYHLIFLVSYQLLDLLCGGLEVGLQE